MESISKTMGWGYCIVDQSGLNNNNNDNTNNKTTNRKTRTTTRETTRTTRTATSRKTTGARQPQILGFWLCWWLWCAFIYPPYHLVLYFSFPSTSSCVVFLFLFFSFGCEVLFLYWTDSRICNPRVITALCDGMASNLYMLVRYTGPHVICIPW